MNDFEKSFMATFIGCWIGHLIDNTKFGIWFNNNRTIDIIWNMGKRILWLVISLLVIYYFILVIGQFSS